MDTTRSELKSALAIIEAVAQAIKDLTRNTPMKGVPSGHLYANLSGSMTLSQYEKVIGILKESKLVKEKNHFLTWVGPVEEKTN